MSAPKILSATETTFSVTGEPFTYTYSGSTGVLTKCVELTIESYQRRSVKLSSRLEYHTIDAIREVVVLFDNRGNVWATMEIRHTVDLVRHCEKCGADNASRYVAGNYQTGSLVGMTLCGTCRRDAIGYRLDLHWMCRRVDHFAEEPFACPNGYNDGTCDAFCGPNGHADN